MAHLVRLRIWYYTKNSVWFAIWNIYKAVHRYVIGYIQNSAIGAKSYIERLADN